MFCPNCGNQMSDGAKFCANCGWSKGKSANKQSAKSLVIEKKIVKPLLVVLAVVVIGLIVYNMPKPNGKVYEFSKISKVKSIMEYAKDKHFSNFAVDKFDTVKFGSYPQSDENGNNREPIEWIVLERQGDKALLLSKYIIDCKCYNDEGKSVTWENCTLRNWLNMHFYNTAFSSSEQNKILTTNIINSDNSVYGINDGKDTNDKIFCLSIEEIRRYFGNGTEEEYAGYRLGKNAVTRGTNYAKTVDNGGYTLIVDGENSNYWLRSPGFSHFYAAFVTDFGFIFKNGIDVNYHRDGVRPALWVSY